MAKTVIAFMVAASICGNRAGVEVCSVQTTHSTVPTRSECVTKAQEMVKNATLVFSYIKVAGPYKTSIRCISPNVKKPETVKPEKTGTVDAPVAPTVCPPSWWDMIVGFFHAV
jgi:hypothetical protein